MSSSYIGSDAAFYGTLSLMTGGDRPTASAFRVPLERLLDNAAYLESRMIDMSAGGTYNPSGDITIGTSRLRLTVALNLDSGADLVLSNGSDVDMNSGSQISCEVGSFIRVAGELEILTGGVVDIQSGGSIVGAAGATIQLKDADGLTIDADSLNFVLALAPSHITETVLGTGDWTPQRDGALLQHDVGGASSFLVPIRIRPGDSLNFILVEVEGGYGAGHGGSPPAPGDRVLAELISISASGTVTVIASQEDDVAGAGYDASHAFSFSGPWLAGSVPLYVRITGETGANAVADTTAVKGISGSVTARVYRGASEVY